MKNEGDGEEWSRWGIRDVRHDDVKNNESDEDENFKNDLDGEKR